MNKCDTHLLAYSHPSDCPAVCIYQQSYQWMDFCKTWY